MHVRIPQLTDGPARICRDRGVPGTFFYWSGASGRRYLHTIFEIDACPDMSAACMVFVRRGRDGSRAPIDVADAGLLPAATVAGRTIMRARLRGANEVHVHLLANGSAERTNVIADLKARLSHHVHTPAAPSSIALRP